MEKNTKKYKNTKKAVDIFAEKKVIKKSTGAKKQLPVKKVAAEPVKKRGSPKKVQVEEDEEMEEKQSEVENSFDDEDDNEEMELSNKIESDDSPKQKNKKKQDTESEKSSSDNEESRNNKVKNYIYLFEQGELVDYFTDIIKNNYLKDNPEEQSVWTDDQYDMSFIVKLEEGWVLDKGGKILRKHVIDPLLRDALDTMKDYDPSITKTKETSYEFFLGSQMVAQIKCERIHKEILKSLIQIFRMPPFEELMKYAPGGMYDNKASVRKTGKRK